MHLLTHWFIHNPVAANLIMLLILATGALKLSDIRIEGFPKLPANAINVEASYDNVFTSHVDSQVTQKY